ncbi:MAG: hypothetical protein JST85_29090 [Acidobacteria bacterium]|nr:hypothetical protein [Acidobacteriota bacterium]
MNRKQQKLTAVILAMFVSVFGTTALLLNAPVAQSQSKPGKSVYRGNIFYFGGGRSLATNFTLTINSWTPESEVRRLMNALRNGGQDEFQKLVGKEKRGTIQVDTNLGLDLNAVWMTQGEDGRKISAIAQRWMGFGELRRGGRSVDYPFTYIELWVEEDGDVEGTLFPAARIRAKGDNSIEVENFGIYPARLTNVKEHKK